jgi:hypothetical protein
MHFQIHIVLAVLGFMGLCTAQDKKKTVKGSSQLNEALANLSEPRTG